MFNDAMHGCEPVKKGLVVKIEEGIIANWHAAPPGQAQEIERVRHDITTLGSVRLATAFGPLRQFVLAHPPG